MRTWIFILLGMVLAACQETADMPADVTSEADHTDQQASQTGAAEPAGHTDDGHPLGRLPHTVIPLHYHLALTVLPDEAGFSGTTRIDLDFTETTDTFYLHGQDLTVARSELRLADGQSLKAEYEQVDESGVVRIRLPKPVDGRGRLIIDYRAPFNGSLEALYKVSAGGEDYAFTQFQAISARLAFPGFDDPSFKAPFEFELTVREDHTAIASTPAVSSEPLEDGLKRVRFARSEPLPTYLVAFAVGPFDVVEWEALPRTPVRDRTVPLRGIAVKGKGEQLSYALQNTQGILESLEDYFGIPYPFAKLDIIAVPDFNAGAMENVGAITYRESILLVDDQATPQRRWNFQRVHAHELAHQWFGNYVTPVWWDDIWLNESFATWMAYASLDAWNPEGNFRQDMTSRALGVMGRDTLMTARQIRQPIESNHDIASAFDSITYSKGGAVLTMFESLLGRDAFRAGVREFMRNNAFGNATSDDFIGALSHHAADREPAVVARAFRSFLEQPGLPLVQLTSQCAADRVSVTLTQSRFIPLGSEGSKDRQWQIPVCLKYGDAEESRKTCVILDQAEQTFELPANRCPAYVMPNADSAGYYRWSLSQHDWNRLLQNTALLSTEEMMSLSDSLDGAFNVGAADVSTYMSVVSQLVTHPSWRIATDPMGQLRFIETELANPGQLPRLQAYFTRLYSARADQVGMESHSDRDAAQLQASLIRFLSDNAKVPALRETLEALAIHYTGYQAGGQIDAGDLNQNLVGQAVKIAAESGGPAFIDHLNQLLDQTDDPVVRSRLLSGIGRNQDPAKTPELMDLALSERLHDNEIYTVAVGQISAPATREVAWHWLQQNLDAFLERIPSWGKGNVAAFGGGFCDVERLAEVDAFFGPRVDALQGGPRSLGQTLERIRLCAAKVEAHKPGFDAFVDSLNSTP